MVNAIILLNKIFKLVNLVQQLPVLLYKLVILIERGEEIIVSPGAQWFACELKSCSDQASTITLLEAWLLIPWVVKQLVEALHLYDRISVLVGKLRDFTLE